jgi:hypothetical protein
LQNEQIQRPLQQLDSVLVASVYRHVDMLHLIDVECLHLLRIGDPLQLTSQVTHGF